MFQFYATIRRSSSYVQKRNKQAVYPRQIVSILGAPHSFGQKWIGTDVAPDVLRSHGLTNRIRKLGFMVEDFGNMKFPKRSVVGGQERYKDLVGECNRIIAERWIDVAKDDTKFILLLGGDHSVALGSVAAAMKNNPDVVIIWVDAHADLNTPLTSVSGNYHGMPLGFAMRLEGTDGPDFEWLDDYPTLKPENLVYIGLRDVDEPERKMIKALNIKSYDMSDIDRMGIGGVMKEVVKYVDDRPMHLSYDIDSCDPFFAGATGTKVRGGLTYRESHFVCEALARTNNLISMDMVEVNPELHVGLKSKESTYFTALSLIESCVGRDILE